jgi:lipopolysaccharide export system protein LptA
MRKILLLTIFISCVCLGVSASDVIKSKKADLPPVLGGIVRSDQWVIKKNPPLEEFIGNVSYKNPYYEIKADHAIFNRLTGVFFAEGNVWGKKQWADGSITEMFCHTAEYDRNAQIATAYSNGKGFVKINHTEPKLGSWQSESKKALFDEATQRVDLVGEVSITGEKNNARAEKISYYYEGDSFEFIGNPVIWGIYKNYDFAVTGKKAKSTDFFNNLEVNEKVKGWIKTKNGVLFNEVGMP